MKIWCDFCGEEKATVFCSADEAALCDGCDNRVHHANTLASKHLRFSLLNSTSEESSSSSSSLCDICQERRGLLFCQEDRAILCGECDLPIHRANEHTEKHSRFLLTGVELSASPSLYPNSSSPSSSEAAAPAAIDEKNRVSASTTIEDNHVSDDNGSISTSSLSEYFTQTIPGWRVEDLLDPPSSATTTNVSVRLVMMNFRHSWI